MGNAHPNTTEASADLAADLQRLRGINTQLVTDFNAMNQQGARQDETIRELTAANALLMNRYAEARVLVEQLERAASEVARYGAVVGSQWARLTIPLLQARSWLAGSTSPTTSKDAI